MPSSTARNLPDGKDSPVYTILPRNIYKILCYSLAVRDRIIEKRKMFARKNSKVMKKQIFVLLALSSLLFSSCGYRENPEPPITQSHHEERELVSTYVYADASYELYSDQTARLVELPLDFDKTSFTIPPTVRTKYQVTEIADHVFRSSTVREVHLSSHITAIGDGAFRDSDLESIVLPDTLTVLGNEVFSGCTHLQSIYFSGSLTSIGASCFYGCSSLKELVLPAGLTSIGEEAFAACTSLETVEFPSALSKIASFAFYQSGTPQLEFKIPASVKEIGVSAFGETAWLTAQTEELVLVGDGVLIRYNGSNQTIFLPGTVHYISNAFDGTPVKTISVPDSVQGIAEGAFENSSVTDFNYNPANATLRGILK